MLQYGYLNRKTDRPPEVIVLTRGWKRFCDAYFIEYKVAMSAYGSYTALKEGVTLEQSDEKVGDEIINSLFSEYI